MVMVDYLLFMLGFPPMLIMVLFLLAIIGGPPFINLAVELLCWSSEPNEDSWIKNPRLRIALALAFWFVGGTALFLYLKFAK